MDTIMKPGELASDKNAKFGLIIALSLQNSRYLYADEIVRNRMLDLLELGMG